jgi:hypothetical protein
MGTLPLQKLDSDWKWLGGNYGWGKPSLCIVRCLSTKTVPVENILTTQTPEHRVLHCEIALE